MPRKISGLFKRLNFKWIWRLEPKLRMCDELRMSLIVQKFGGTSVGTPERIRAVAQRIAKTRAEGNQLVVVVSAMGHSTDELVDLAHEVSKHPPHREMDMLLSAGERISMALLSMALADCKVPALSFTGSQTGIITDSSHSRARIRRILGDRIRSALAENKVAIVAGFQGVSESKEITTLGRGGSDTTAVALAAALKASRCEIFTDVDGVYSADPRWVQGARLWKAIPHDLMVEMATRGAGVLHPRSVELAKQFQVPLCVRSSLNENEGTFVVTNTNLERQSQGMEEFAVTGVTADKTKIYFTVSLTRPTVLGALWEKASQSHLPIIAPVFADGETRFFSDRDGESEWRKNLEELAADGFVKEYEINSNIVPLSVVGDRFSQDGLALHEIIGALAKKDILVSIGSASALAVTVGVPLSRVEEGVQVLHEVYLEGRIDSEARK
jgi:aspartate kinase